MKVNPGEKLGFELFHVCEAMKKLDVDELEVVREIDEYADTSPRLKPGGSQKR